jgi:hypothetical protein
MPRTKLNKVIARTEFMLTLDDKKALQKWCDDNGLTISEVIRQELKLIIDQGYRIR